MGERFLGEDCIDDGGNKSTKGKGSLGLIKTLVGRLVEEGQGDREVLGRSYGQVHDQRQW